MYTEKWLLPSNIYFSQESINSYFDSKSAHANIKIGETLDQLCDGTITILDIPMIKVVLKDGKYFTEDNRRLWLFQQLEKLDKCRSVRVRASNSYQTMFRRDQKFTTCNGGTSVTVRGSPGGRWYKVANRVSRKTTFSNVGFAGTASYDSSSSISPVRPYQHRHNSNTGHVRYGGTAQPDSPQQKSSNRGMATRRANSAKPASVRSDCYTPNTQYRRVNDEGIGTTGILVMGAVVLVGLAIFGRLF